MTDFSDWINCDALVDLQFGGAMCTWSNHQFPPTMSRLDRFLVSGEWMDLFLEVCQIAMPNPISDPYPIILDTKLEQWGPTSFRFELMWVQENDLRWASRKLVEGY